MMGFPLRRDAWRTHGCAGHRLSLTAILATALGAHALAQPVILQQPADQLVPLQSPAKFEVIAQGKGALRYQWRQNGVPLKDFSGAQESTLTISAVFPPQAGTYDVVVFDDVSFVISQPARLLLAIPAGQFTDNFLDTARRPVIDPGGLVRFNNLKATREPNEPLDDGKTGHHSVWMTWIAPGADGIAHFDTRGSGFDTLLAVYQGDSLSTLTRVTSDDDAGGFTTSSVDFNVQPQGTYFIAVDGR